MRLPPARRACALRPRAWGSTPQVYPFFTMIRPPRLIQARICCFFNHGRRHAHLMRWWSQTGSNRRHPACKAGALPAELWPQNPGMSTPLKSREPTNVVGLGRFELPTSRLSSARSNQLSYRPGKRGCVHEKKEKRRRRNPALFAIIQSLKVPRTKSRCSKMEPIWLTEVVSRPKPRTP